ncbi:NAD(P)/FAD-dependent oxidoreductase [Salinarimonas ramus]|uniref:Sarcosine oxidase subunit beta n=1 Tax=Salinarimonas ramus TaxID=690164 RepID=A0A917V8Q3_9HYPH|nr:FAD-binding oxidoreductase [Salinarimonas ramus]GGK50873.1 sarcosine oxidase subunit beta [Salinarimonas ramus]
MIDVVVVGGGLAGAASAYFLAEEGVGVTLLERGDLNTKASGSNAGSIHAQIPHAPFVENGEDWARGFAPTIPIMMEGIALWRAMEAELGVDLGVATPGGLLVAETPAQMRAVVRKAEIERAHGLPVEILSREDLRRLAPYVSPAMEGGAFCPIEGKANPLAATPAFAAAAERLGARIRRFVEVRAITAERVGFTLETNAGPIRARRIVNAAGAEAAALAAMAGVALPLEAHPIQVTVTEPVAPLVKHLLYFAGEKLTLKQTPLGALLVGGGWPARRDATGRLSASPESLAANLALATRVVPGVADARVVRTWPALVNGTADWRPILGEPPGVPGFYMAIFPWMGFTAGPVAARLVADMILGRESAIDVAAFAPGAKAA